MAIGAGLAIRLWPDRTGCLAAAVATEAAAMVGLRLALARFPWADLPEPPKVEAAGQKSCGWPFDALKPEPPKSRLGRPDLVALSLLLGWFFFAAEAVVADLGPAPAPLMVFGQLLVMMTFGRLAAYAQGHAPPIGLWGRIRTGRWIIPGYDQIFVAPLAIAIIGILAVDRFRPPFLTDEVALAGGLALAMLVCTTAGPDLARWRLTGHHRLVPPGNVKRSGQEFRAGWLTPSDTGRGLSADQVRTGFLAARTSSGRLTGVVLGAAWSSAGSSSAIARRARAKASRVSRLSVSVGSIIIASGTISGK